MCARQAPSLLQGAARARPMAAYLSFLRKNNYEKTNVGTSGTE
jgi:hypothetical protein